MAKAAKFLVLGFDSGDKDLVMSWAQEGALPHLKALLDESLSFETENPPGLIASSVWPSFYTGCSPARHGIYDPLHKFDPDSYEERVCTLDDYAVDPIWTVLSNAGRRVAVIDAPYSFPERQFNGTHLLDWGTHAPMRHYDVTLHADRFHSWPPELAKDVASRFEPDPIGTCDSLYLSSAADFKRFRDGLVRRVERKTDLLQHFLEQDDWDLFLAVFSECHCAGHQCWHFHDETHPRHDPRLTAAVGNPLKDVYVALDAAVGRILQTLDQNTTMMLLFSHGTGPCYTGTGLLDEILGRLEALQVPEMRSVGHGLLRLWRRLPAPLRRALAPIKRQLLPGLRSQMGGVKRSERRFFELITNDAAAGVRFNVAGREANGQIQRGEEYEAVCRQLIEDLFEIVDTDTGRPIVKSVLKTAETYSGAQLEALPDLLVEWNRETQFRRVRSPKIGTMDYWPINRTGDHRPVGMVLAKGPDIRPGRIRRPVPVYDLAPTIAARLGVEMKHVEGKPMAALAGKGQRPARAG